VATPVAHQEALVEASRGMVDAGNWPSRKGATPIARTA